MTSPPADDRGVRRLRNDVDDLYDLLGVVQATVAGHTVTLAEHTVTLAEHTTTLAGHTATLDDHTVKLDHIIELLETR